MHAIIGWILVFAFLGTGGPSHAADLSGACTTPLPAAGCPYTVTGAVSVPAGATCTVPTGCALAGQGNAITVAGTLALDGATVNDVTLAVANGGRLTASSTTMTAVREVEFAAGSTVTWEGGAVTQHTGVCPTVGTRTLPGFGYSVRPFWRVLSSAVTVRDVAITTGTQQCRTTGVVVEGGASPTFAGNMIRRNPAVSQEHGPALLWVTGGAPVLADNTFTGAREVCCGYNDGIGLALHDSAATVTGNVFADSPRGLRLSGGDVLGFVAAPTIGAAGAGNTFQGSTTHGMVVTGRVAPTIQHNDVTTSTTGVSAGDGTGAVTITANTFRTTAAGGVTVAVSRPTTATTVTDNTIRTNGRGVVFDSGAKGEIRGNTIRFESVLTGGTPGRSGIRLRDTASPLVTVNTIEDDAAATDTGLDLLGVTQASTAVVTGNSVCGTGQDTPLAASLDLLAGATGADVGANEFPCGTAGGFTLGGALHGTLALGGFGLFPAQATYRVPESLSIAAGATLTVSAGTTLQLQGNGLTVAGTLELDGATVNDVTLVVANGGRLTATDTMMTAVREVEFAAGSTVTWEAGAATQHTGVCPTVATRTLPGFSYSTRPFWRVQSSAVAVRDVTITTGTQQCRTTGVVVEGGASPTFAGNMIRRNPAVSQEHGPALLWVTGGAPVLADNTFTGAREVCCGYSDGVGLALHDSAATVTGNLFADSPRGLRLSGGDVLGFVAAPTIGAAGAGNTFQGSTTHGMVVTGRVAPTIRHNDVTTSTTGLSVADGTGAVMITANTFRTTGAGGISVASSRLAAVTAVTGNTIRTNGRGIAFDSGATGEISGNTIRFESVLTGGTPGRAGIRLRDTASPLVTANTIEDDAAATDTGLDLLGVTQASTAVVTGNTVCGTAQDTPLAASLDLLAGATGADVGDNEFPCGTAGGFTLGGALHGTLALGGFGPLPAQTTYRVPESLNIAAGATLSVSAGTALQLQGNGVTVAGTLELDGATVNDVTLVVTNGGRLTATDTTMTAVREVEFAAGSTVTWEGGAATQHTGVCPTVGTRTMPGFGYSVRPFWRVQSSAVTVRDVTITTGTQQCRTMGVVVEGGASPTFAGNTIRRNPSVSQEHGPALLWVTGGAPVLTDNHLRGAREVCCSNADGFGLALYDSAATVSGGSFADMPRGILVDGTSQASAQLLGSTVQTTAVGLTLRGASSTTVSGNTFTANPTAIAVNGVGAISTIGANTLVRNTYALSFASAAAFGSAFPIDFDTNTFTGSRPQNAVRLPATLGSGSLVPLPVGYSAGNLSVPSGANVVLGPGTSVLMDSSASVTVDGELICAGDPQSPVTFTSASKDSRWGGLSIRNKTAISPTVLSSCIVEFGGAGGLPALRLDNASIDVVDAVVWDNAANGIDVVGGAPIVSDSTIVNNAGNGIRVAGATPVIGESSIFANGQLGVRNETCSIPSAMIDAQHVYWGSDAGPYDAADDGYPSGVPNQPAQAAEEVSACVDYDPWTRIGPTIAGTITPLSGGGQSGVVGTTLPEPLVVEVRSTLGSPLENIDVIFSVVSGGATVVEPQPLRTDANGQAAATIRLGLVPGPLTVAVTARDLNSPLAIFVGEASTPNLFAAEAVTLTDPPGETPRLVRSGDVDGDGRVTNADAAIIDGVAAGVLRPGGKRARRLAAGDVNGDGRVDRADALMIQGHLVGMVAASTEETR